STGPERVAAVWSAPVADAIAKDLTGETAESFKRARSRLDAWWQAWADLHGEACRATRVRGEQSDELLSRRMLCLDRRFAEGLALVNVLKQRDDGALAQSPEAVDALTSLHGCSDTEALLAEVAPPAGELLGSQVERVRALLREAKARFDAGLYKDAEARASEAVKRAREGTYRPVLAEALVALGRVQEHAGDLKGAEATLTEAISVSEGAKTDALTAEAATLLTLVLGVRQARYGEAHAWGKLAEGTIHRIGGSLPLQARLTQTSGLVLYQEGKLDDAIAAHQKAVELFVKLEPDGLALADAYSALGAAYRGGRKAKEAMAAFEQALVIFRERVGPNSDLTATALNGVGSSLMLDGRFDEALKLYTQAHDVFVKRLGPTHFRTVTAVNNIGVVLAEQGRYADALPYFEKVVKVREATLAATDAKTADALANVGMLLVELQRWEDAAKRFEKARGILQGYPLDHFSQAEPLLGEAKLFIAKGEREKAVPLLERVLKLCESKQGFRFDYTRARASFVLARAQRSRALAEKARAAFVSFGPERFKRDLTEVDAWLATTR
ncbi:MAG: tetratricopeptide repeat protein, partial [Myxococcaceae bacterium]|nr:tetratricopeptide repeat protein [Myxococcaceae bacterium]